ncbi:uncharacterized protein LOC114828485 [Galendromus occidentalis]|uniref:Uncharacterized protein LOC114828485 n=1 Tax=Galendromus occidentalis TaxID=34638 RepID=A0AAJ7WJ08_9ACAR|nr:uncharacterized protein LOC114828485 [Galendromus occidentalis]
MGARLLLGSVMLCAAVFVEARVGSNRRQLTREDKDLLAMRDVNTNFMYTLVCDNSVPVETRMARYECLLNRIAPLDRNALVRCVNRFDFRRDSDFIRSFCRGQVGCRRFRYCIAREREILMELATTAKPVGEALGTVEPTEIPVTTTTTTTTTEPPTEPPTTTEQPIEIPSTMKEGSKPDPNADDGAGESGRGDDVPSSPAPLLPDNIEAIDEEDDYFPCLCAKKAKYLKRASKMSRQGRSLNGVEQLRAQRQLEPAKLVFPLGVVRQCLIECGDHANGVGSATSLRRYYSSIFRPF